MRLLVWIRLLSIVAAAGVVLVASESEDGCALQSLGGCSEESDTVVEESASLLQTTNSPAQHLKTKAQQHSQGAATAAAQQPTLAQVLINKNGEPDKESSDSVSESITIGIISLGIVCLLMSFFYSLNQPDIIVRNATWKTLTSMISIFCASLIFASMKDLMVLLLHEGTQSTAPAVRDLAITFIRLSVLFVLAQVALFISRFWELPLKIVGIFGAHVLAFAAIDAFGSFEQFIALSETWLAGPLSFVPVGLSALGILCLCCVASIVRYLVCCVDPHGISEHNLAWDSQCIESETEFGSITVGFLLSLAARCLILGELPPTFGSPKDPKQWQVWVLFGTAIALIFAAVVTTLLVRTMLKQAWAPRYVRCAQIVQLVVATMAAFCLVSWGQWQWSSELSEGQGESEQMTARMLVALSFSALVFIAIFSLKLTASWSLVERRSLEALISGFGLLLGVSWYSIYDLAVMGVGKIFAGQSAPTLVDVGIRLGVCVVLLPAWGLYILPQAVLEKQPANMALRGNGSVGQ